MTRASSASAAGESDLAAPELRREVVPDPSAGGGGTTPAVLQEPEHGARSEALDRNQAALACLERGEFAQAETLLQEAVTLDPQDPTLRMNLSRTRVRLGQTEWNAGRAQAALDWFHLAFAADPDGGAPAEWIASILLRRGERAAAVREVEAGLASTPASAGLLRLRAELAFLAGDLAAAVADARAALVLENNPRARERLLQLEEEERIFREFLTDSTAHFDSRYDPQDAALVQHISDLHAQLESAWSDVIAMLGVQPEGRLLVIWLTPERWKGSAPVWSAGLYDGRVRLLVRDPGRNDAGLRAVMRHELTHAVLHALGGRLPTWLHEGLAQRAEGRDVTSARAALRAGLPLPTAEALDGDWTSWTDARQVEAAYALALSMVESLESSSGTSALRSLLLAEPALGFEAAWLKVYARPYPEWEVEHRAWLMRDGG